jgi:hypothetical protein
VVDALQNATARPQHEIPEELMANAGRDIDRATETIVEWQKLQCYKGA